MNLDPPSLLNPEFRRGTLIERLRLIGIPEDKIAAVAVEATVEALEINADSRRACSPLDDPSGPRGMEGMWWTKKHAAHVAGCSVRQLERATRSGSIRVNRVNRRAVFVFAEDVLRWRGLMSLRVA